MAKNYRQCNQLITDMRDIIHRAYSRGYEQAKVDYKRNNEQWIKQTGGTYISYICSGCKSKAVAQYCFCPHCGADMRGDAYAAE